MKDTDKELNFDELEEVSGGLTPNYPSGIKNGSIPKNPASCSHARRPSEGARSGS